MNTGITIQKARFGYCDTKTSKNIRNIQNALKAAGCWVNPNGKTSNQKSTGYFGVVTRASMIKFQHEKMKITDDKKLYYFYSNGKKVYARCGDKTAKALTFYTHPIKYKQAAKIISPVWKASDADYSDTVQTLLLELNFDWYFAKSQQERADIVNKAEDIRNKVSAGLGWWLDKSKLVTEAAANNFSFILGGSVSTNERDEMLSLNQVFQKDLSIKDTDNLENAMFIAGMIVPGGIFENGVRSWIQSDLNYEVKKTCGMTIWRKFTQAMEKGFVSREFGEQGIKEINGYVGKTLYQYELKILGEGADWTLVGNLDKESGHIIWVRLVTHDQIKVKAE